jgi:protoporphyrinogen oxidase
MACAYQILKDAPGREVMIIDTAPFVGGAGASFKWKEHTLDYGPHAFHTRGSEPEQLVRDLFADEPDALIEGTKQVHVYLRGKRFNYPLQVRGTPEVQPLLKRADHHRVRLDFALPCPRLYPR